MIRRVILIPPPPHLQANQGGTTLWTPTFVASTFESDSDLPTRRRRRRRAARALAELEAPLGPTCPRVETARASSTFRRTRLLKIYERGGWTTVVAAVADRKQQGPAHQQHQQSCLPPALPLEPAVNSGRRGPGGWYPLVQRYQGGVDLSQLPHCAMESKRAAWEE